MATATKRRPAKKAAKKPTGKSVRKVVASAPVATTPAATVKSAGGSKFAAGQKPLESMEDVDDKIPALEEACQRVLADREKKSTLAESVREGLGEVGKLLKEHDRDCYIVSGKKFVPVAGEPTVKIFKVKQGQ